MTTVKDELVDLAIGAPTSTLKHELKRVPEELYHYTCSHGAQHLGDRGELLTGRMLRPDAPGIAAAAQCSVVWLTDLAHPGYLALGFDPDQTPCDHLAHRYRVLDVEAMVYGLRIRWWPAYARAVRIPRAAREELEGRLGARPAHWWVSPNPVPVELDGGWPA